MEEQNLVVVVGGLSLRCQMGVEDGLFDLSGSSGSYAGPSDGLAVAH